MMKSILAGCFLLLAHFAGQAQATHTVTDPEKGYKEARDLFSRGQYGLAYPLMKALLEKYPEKELSNYTYLREDLLYYNIVCRLKLEQETAIAEAVEYVNSINNEPRRQMMSFHLAHYYYVRGDYESAIQYYGEAGINNLTNEQVAEAKFEKAYAYFNLKQFGNARPLFNEIMQLPDHKYNIPATYYYGFISYYDKDYDAAMKAFQAVEQIDPYREIVPYYIAEIHYFRGNKAEAQQYANAVLERDGDVYYANQLRLLSAQVYYEEQDYKSALPLLDAYVNSSDKVTKEVMYEYSFAHYREGNIQKAIEGFRQLSNEKDSMGQNSMYLLGDLYLKTGDKANARNAFQYSAFNSSNLSQQEVSRFNYAKLSYELGYQDIALNELRKFINDYPSSVYDEEAKEILLSVLSRTSNFREAMEIYSGFPNPTLAMQQVYPSIQYGRAIELINDQQLGSADELFSNIIANRYAGNILPYAHFWKGEIAFRQQRYPDAVRHTNQFLQSGMPPQGEASTASANYNLGYSYLYLEQYARSQEHFENITSRISSSSTPLEQDAFLRGGDAAYMQRNFSRAGTVYDAVIAQSLPQADYATFQKAMMAGIRNSDEKIRLLNGISTRYPASPLVQEANYESANTLIADEKFREALPYLDKVLVSSNEGLKPRAHLKAGLAYYNLGNNRESLSHYTELLKKYPHSPEANEALESARAIFVEEGRTQEYIRLRNDAGYAVSVSEADSLSFASASLKYYNNDCPAAITAMNKYISDHPDGNYVLDAHFFKSDCYVRAKDFSNALTGFTFVANKGYSKYYEASALEAARIYYFEMKNYGEARKYFEALRTSAVSQDVQLEALRGLARSYYQLKDYAQANEAAQQLLERKDLTTDDKSIGNLVLGKSLQLQNDWDGAIRAFKTVSSINRSAWGAEARYEIARSYFKLNNLSQAEKSANAVIKETGSYDHWVTSAYILLGDIFMEQKDYFNAKATYESVAQNAVIPELKREAADKLEAAIAEERKESKISN